VAPIGTPLAQTGHFRVTNLGPPGPPCHPTGLSWHPFHPLGPVETAVPKLLPNPKLLQSDEPIGHCWLYMVICFIATLGLQLWVNEKHLLMNLYHQLI